MKIEELDKNFKIDTNISREGLKFLSVKDGIFDIYGCYSTDEDGLFVRMPHDVAKEVNECVDALAKHTAGIRVRFKTDSPYIALKIKYPNILLMNHMPVSGIAGFDIYALEDGEYRHLKTAIPAYGNGPSDFEMLHEVGERKMRDYLIVFPLYNEVNEVYVGIDENSEIFSGSKYKNNVPIVYYGSSITQGACASRPGNAYQEIVSRRLDLDYINLGFSGGAKAEPKMIEYLKNLDMSCFVMDYDYNAPSLEHLEKTHLPMYKEMRKAHIDIPFVLMSRPVCRHFEAAVKAKEIIKATYDYAVKSGDTNIYNIDCSQIFSDMIADSWCVDEVHPNDLGFMEIANAVTKVLGNVIDDILKN